MLQEITTNFLDFSLDILPYFFVALFIASLINFFISTDTVEKWLKGDKAYTLLTASFIGTLMPLCTCGLIPLAVALRKKGGDLKHVICFLSSGTACSITVLFLTIIIIDFEITLYRFIAALCFGVITGYVASLFIQDILPEETSCGCHDCETTRQDNKWKIIGKEFWEGIKDFLPWVMVSLVLAACASVLLPEDSVESVLGYESPFATLIASLIGFPFYFCSGSELPLIKALLAKGMGNGSAVSFMTAAPIVNIISFTVLIKWLGVRGTIIYFIIAILTTTLIGALFQLI